MSEQKTNPEPDIMSPDAHLSRLLRVETQKTWLAGFVENLKDILRPQKLPPLEVTSKPVAVRSIWGFTGGQENRAGLTSFLVHATVIVLLFTLGTNKAVQDKVREAVTLVAPDLTPYVPDTKPQPKQMGGGGGGGDNSPMPVSKGKLPKPSPRQFVPPAAVVHNDNPKLVMEPTIVAPPDLQLPNVNMAAWGDPFGKGTLPSNGPGSGAGMGSGKGGGVGPGDGGGYGPGKGGGFGAGAYRFGGGVSQPTLLHKVEPEYSEEARKAKYQGTVVLALVVDEKGQPREIRVLRAVGLGLDEKAIDAVRQWKFRPGYLNNKPVPVIAQVEVNFRLL